MFTNVKRNVLIGFAALVAIGIVLLFSLTQNTYADVAECDHDWKSYGADIVEYSDYWCEDCDIEITSEEEYFAHASESFDGTSGHTVARSGSTSHVTLYECTKCGELSFTAE